MDGKDVTCYALSIVEDVEETNLLFLGTENGLYTSIDRRNKCSEEFPTESVKSLVVHPREQDLVIETFECAA